MIAEPGGHRESAYLIDLVQRHKVTTLHFVPSMLQIFLETSGVESCTSLKRVICSGEALPLDLQNRFFERSKAELHNLYGPTEAAVDVTSWTCSREEEGSTVPIGRPIANMKIHILDRNFQPVPIHAIIHGPPGQLNVNANAIIQGFANPVFMLRPGIPPTSGCHPDALPPADRGLAQDAPGSVTGARKAHPSPASH